MQAKLAKLVISSLSGLFLTGLAIVLSLPPVVQFLGNLGFLWGGWAHLLTLMSVAAFIGWQAMAIAESRNLKYIGFVFQRDSLLVALGLFAVLGIFFIELEMILLGFLPVALVPVPIVVPGLLFVGLSVGQGLFYKEWGLSGSIWFLLTISLLVAALRYLIWAEIGGNNPFI